MPTDNAMTAVVDLMQRLAGIGVVRSGDFALRSGRESALYFDLRFLVSHPTLLRNVAQAYAEVANGIQFDVLAALPFAGLPIGVAFALELDRPLVYPRPAKKAYGTGNSVEGAYESGQIALVVDDVITDGGAKSEGIDSLRSAGLEVRDVLVFLDREEGGKETLASVGCALHSITTLCSALEILGTS